MDESGFDEFFDFVVVNNGRRSMCAAFFMKAPCRSIVSLEKTRVAGPHRASGSAIEPLYAAAINTASMIGRYYPSLGSSLGPSFTRGYVAAKHADNAGNSAA